MMIGLIQVYLNIIVFILWLLLYLRINKKKICMNKYFEISADEKKYSLNNDFISFLFFKLKYRFQLWIIKSCCHQIMNSFLNYRSALLDNRLGQGRFRGVRKIPKHPQGSGCAHCEPRPMSSQDEANTSWIRLPIASWFHLRWRRRRQGRVQRRWWWPNGLRKREFLAVGRPC